MGKPTRAPGIRLRTVRREPPEYDFEPDNVSPDVEWPGRYAL